MSAWTRRRLNAAIEFAKTRETNWPRDFSTQEKIFGSLLGPIPKSRAATNGVIIRNGYVVARVRRHHQRRPDLLGGQEHARDGRWHRRA